MAAVEVYRFAVYDITKDQMVVSRRMGQRHAIEKIAHGAVIEESGIAVDESALNSDLYGFTEIDYVPVAYVGGFQKAVKKD